MVLGTGVRALRRARGARSQRTQAPLTARKAEEVYSSLELSEGMGPAGTLVLTL